ncbi:MAG: phosphatidylglycerol lysyltransferase [Paracoccaceae bacterium]|jgi:phosphatidylglycerol lysyltransferase
MGFLRVEMRQVFGSALHLATHPYARNLPFLLIGFWFAWLLAGQVQNTDLRLVESSVSEISLWQWVGSIVAMLVSFLAVASYDLVASRALGLRLHKYDALQTGFVATALAQLAGLGLASGSLARWRMLGAGRFTLWQATMLTLVVTTGFLAAAAVLTAASALVFHTLPLMGVIVACGVLVGFAIGLIACVIRPTITFAGRTYSVPKLKTALAFILLGAVDLGFAALAFWLFLPSGTDITFFGLLPVLLLATVIGVVSGVPGGVGPFEMTCLSLLPAIGQEPVLAAIFGYRLVYYFAPALLAIIVLLYRELRRIECRVYLAAPSKPEALYNHSNVIARLIDRADRADARLIHSNEFGVMPNAEYSGFLLTAEVGNTLLAVSDPIGHLEHWEDLIENLKTEARFQNLSPVIYKCGSKAAKIARQVGFKTHRIGQEAVIDPQKFTLDGSQMKGLRRKLNQAEKAKVRVAHCEDTILPLDRMRQVSDLWTQHHGHARGFSMGKFLPNNTAHHQFYLAWQEGRLIGFIGLWSTENEISLDLMRMAPNAPTGVMQALVCGAIRDAADQNSARFSLASVPFLPIAQPASLPERLANWLYHNRAEEHCGQGCINSSKALGRAGNRDILRQPVWHLQLLLALISCGA